MAKQGQHRDSAHDKAKSKGNNDPSKSVTIVTGTPKKQESYEADVYAKRDPYGQAQAKKNEWNEDTRDKPMPDRVPMEGNIQPKAGGVTTVELNPDRLAGQNSGPSSSVEEKGSRTAYDVKDLHDRLRGFPDDMLKQIPILAVGSRLQQGATYVDLNDPAAREITGMGDMEVGPEHYYVPKSEVDHFTWNRLLDIRTPERVGDPGETRT